MTRRPAGTVVVTGASRGIGAAIAARFRAEGWRVYGTSRRRVASPAGIEMLVMDVRSDRQVREAVAHVEESAGAIDVLVNNAGTTHGTLAEETPPETAREVLETNLFGTARVIDACLPGMRARGRGRIVNIGSLAAWVGEPGEAFYAASKAALARYSQALRHETWALGIDVCLVEPGAFHTGIIGGTRADGDGIPEYDAIRAPVRERFHRALRGGRDPAVAAARVWRVATARRTHFRYTAGPERAIPYVSVLLPQTLTDRLLRHAFGLPTTRARTGGNAGARR